MVITFIMSDNDDIYDEGMHSGCIMKKDDEQLKQDLENLKEQKNDILRVVN